MAASRGTKEREGKSVDNYFMTKPLTMDMKVKEVLELLSEALREKAAVQDIDEPTVTKECL